MLIRIYEFPALKVKIGARSMPSAGRQSEIQDSTARLGLAWFLLSGNPIANDVFLAADKILPSVTGCRQGRINAMQFFQTACHSDKNLYRTDVFHGVTSLIV
jgi:hypothetical protein